MEEQQQEDKQLFKFRHACNFCYKTFPCGRSLGGHMRSHIISISAAAQTQQQKQKQLPAKTKKNKPSSSTGYGLRENPNKTWRIAEHTYKFCKDCGKTFHSSKALFGHMKCHSHKQRLGDSLDDQDSWTNNTSSHIQIHNKMLLDTQSDNETTTAPYKRTRSKRRRTSYIIAAPPTSSSSVDQEQQDVAAISLMMLSRDLTPSTALHSLVDSSDNNNYAYFKEKEEEARSTNLITKFDKDSSTTKISFKGKTSSELLDVQSRFRINTSGVSIKGFLKATKSELDYMSALEDSEGENGRSRVNGAEKLATTLENWVNKPREGELRKNSNNRGKFECTACNKIFHSYQALGGHRASHKKIKGCFASKIDSSEIQNSVETDLSPHPTTESKLVMMNNSEYAQHEEEIVKESKKNKTHECPICLKGFQSGQALGGHKRSHMSGGSESRNFEEPVHEISDFLDLNLPAANDEESNSHADSNRPWWVVESNHKQEPSCLAS